MKYLVNGKLIKCQESEYIDSQYSYVIRTSYPHIKVCDKISDLEHLVLKNTRYINDLSLRHKFINKDSWMLDQKLNDAAGAFNNFSTQIENGQYTLAELQKMNAQFKQHYSGIVSLITKNNEFVIYGFESKYYAKEIFALLGISSIAAYFLCAYGYTEKINKMAVSIASIAALFMMPTIFSIIEYNNNINSILSEIEKDSNEIDLLLIGVEQAISNLDSSNE